MNDGSLKTLASKQTFDEQDYQELALLDENGKETDWYCPLTVLEVYDNGILYIENDSHDYIVDKSDYSSYRVRDCDCSSVVGKRATKDGETV